MAPDIFQKGGKYYVEKEVYPIRDRATGRIIVRNLFRIDFMSLMLFIVILTMVIGYKIDTGRCDEVIENPCGYCAESGCCELIAAQELEPDNYYGLTPSNISLPQS